MTDVAQTTDIDRSGRPKRIRALLTPEGIELKLELASAAERVTALLLDAIFMVLGLAGLTAAIALLAIAAGMTAAPYLATLWILGFFFLRVFYFTAFEMGPRAATPAKRILGLRVISRGGGALTADAVFLRNALRELEIFLPLTLLASQTQSIDLLITISAVVWCGVFLFFPFFNRDRLRVGDIVAGTCVVHAPRVLLGVDLAARPLSDAIAFEPAALEAYGIRELSILESVLRHQDPDSMRVVAERIRRKIGMGDGAGSDTEFLGAYYVALRRHLESRMLFGRRKRDKFDAS